MYIKEDDFLRQVITLAHLYGWKVAHFRHAMKKDGNYITPVQADGAGFPDLVLVRGRIIFAEIKSEKGKLSDAQKEWRDALENTGGEYYTWRISEWDEIVEILKR